MSSGEAYDIETTFLYPINYNWILTAVVIGNWMQCTGVALWGLLWYNDGGEMWQACFELGAQGGQAEFLEAA